MPLAPQDMSSKARSVRTRAATIFAVGVSAHIAQRVYAKRTAAARLSAPTATPETARRDAPELLELGAAVATAPTPPLTKPLSWSCKTTAGVSLWQQMEGECTLTVASEAPTANAADFHASPVLPELGALMVLSAIMSDRYRRNRSRTSSNVPDHTERATVSRRLAEEVDRYVGMY